MPERVVRIEEIARSLTKDETKNEVYSSNRRDE